MDRTGAFVYFLSRSGLRDHYGGQDPGVAVAEHACSEEMVGSDTTRRYRADSWWSAMVLCYGIVAWIFCVKCYYSGSFCNRDAFEVQDIDADAFADASAFQVRLVERSGDLFRNLTSFEAIQRSQSSVLLLSRLAWRFF